jgi:hypothetical protein
MTPVEELGQTSWENRTNKLQTFILQDGWLWADQTTGILVHDRLLIWMKSPSPRNLVRYFKLWGTQDIFDAITRARLNVLRACGSTDFWRDRSPLPNSAPVVNGVQTEQFIAT